MLADQSRKSTLCEVVWVRSEIPQTLVRGETVKTSVTFSNTSKHAFSCSGDDPARLALFFHVAESLNPFEDSVPDLRYPLPEDVGVGAAQTCHFVLQVPSTPGTFRLFVGIVKTQFVWSAAELEGAFVLTVSVVEPAEVKSEFKAEKNSDEALMAPSVHSASGPLRAQETETWQSLVQLESKEPAAASESTSFSSSSDEDYRELETQENSVPDLASPVKFEVSDLTSFFTVGKAEVSKRLLTSLNRIVFVEAGLPASTPMDIFLDHFVALGLEGLPMHFLLENDGPVFQWLPLNTNPLSYSQNWASAM